MAAGSSVPQSWLISGKWFLHIPFSKEVHYGWVPHTTLTWFKNHN